MGRPKKSALSPAEVEPEEISQEVPDEDPARELEPEPGPIPQGAVSQSDAARAALDAGYRKPAQAVAYIKSKFGIDMDPQYFSAIKSRMKAARGEAPRKADAAAPRGKPGRKPKSPPVEGYVAPPEKPKAAGEQPDFLAALKAIKPLVAQFGTDKVHEIVDLLG